MAIMLLLAVLFIFLVSYFISYKYYHLSEDKHELLLSLSSGMLISIIFVEILPRLYSSSYQNGPEIYLGIVLGFVMYHIVEKYLYQHGKEHYALRKRLTLFHLSGNILENFLKGFMIVYIFTLESLDIVRFFALFPFFTENLARGVILGHKSIRLNLSLSFALSIAVAFMLGASLAFFLPFHSEYFHWVFSFAVGAFIYFVIRDELPHGTSGKPTFFAIGAILTVLFVLLFR